MYPQSCAAAAAACHCHYRRILHTKLYICVLKSRERIGLRIYYTRMWGCGNANSTPHATPQIAVVVVPVVVVMSSAGWARANARLYYMLCGPNVCTRACSMNHTNSSRCVVSLSLSLSLHSRGVQMFFDHGWMGISCDAHGSSSNVGVHHFSPTIYHGYNTNNTTTTISWYICCVVLCRGIYIYACKCSCKMLLNKAARTGAIISI